ncbi:MAG: peptidoglycan DD-metalloendopeptidase family protein [Bacteroidales bacterium]|nr:peptidoglycan DD-metalloendopeptidase family protein [Bacteroidales bacterium]
MKEKEKDIKAGKRLVRKLLLTGISSVALVSLRAQAVDISLQSLVAAQKDTAVVSVLQDIDDIELGDKDFIQETYQIPGYSLYDQYWDTEHICSRRLAIPFGGNPLRVILVQSNNNPFFYPCIGNNTVVAAYGMTKGGHFHPGVDLAVKEGSPVKCCFDGVVRMARIYGDYGRVVVVRHYNGLETVYANLGKIMVKPGQILQAGDIIGSSGRAQKTGAEQLHFETRFMNESFNPAMFIDFDYMELINNTLILNETDLVSQEEKKEIIKDEEKKKEVRENTEEKTQENTGQTEYHIVKAGETMYRISVQYHIPLAKLLQMNNMKETDVIDIGQRIRVK